MFFDNITFIQYITLISLLHTQSIISRKNNNDRYYINIHRNVTKAINYLCSTIKRLYLYKK